MEVAWRKNVDKGNETYYICMNANIFSSLLTDLISFPSITVKTSCLES